MIKKAALILLFSLGIFSILLLLGLDVSAQIAPKTYDLIEGKNNITFQETLFASDLLKKDQDIEAISYFDIRTGKTVGYLNHFGGIGRNFLIVPSEDYEVVVKKNTTLII